MKASILPDIAMCGKCAEEVTAPRDRRFMYPFADCAGCGPRFTVTERLPYDRKNTSMKNFIMCDECRKEYENADDRRFHARTSGCRTCGPWVSLYDIKGYLLCAKDEALEKTVNLIRGGAVVAVKGWGGYHLVCDATNEEAVSGLRKRKSSEEKPMPVMFPDLEMLKKETHISGAEESAINSIEKPVVIVNKKENGSIAGSVAPENNTIGVFLPYMTLHYLILKKLKRPVVATSANMTDEPIVKDEEEAFRRLQDIADFILMHNRSIVRRCDDSVVIIAAGRQVSVRRSRGIAPQPVILPFRLGKTVLALGSDMNNTIALGIDDRVYVSQHTGNLDSPSVMDFYEESIGDFLMLFDVDPEVVAVDMLTGYSSTKYGQSVYGGRLVSIQHQHAHILSCMAENEMPKNAEVIGFAFDGTGYGPDNTIWGGEVLTVSYRNFRRRFHLRPYRLPGGVRAVKEPYRTALSLLYETFGDKASEYSIMQEKEKKFILEMLKKNINSPSTTSMGGLFDGVASILGLRHTVSYNAQASVLLEQLAHMSDDKSSYPVIIKNNMIYQLPVIEHIVKDLNAGLPKASIAAKFHNTVTEIIVSASERLKEETGIKHVALAGGVFQNGFLLEETIKKLEDRGFITLTNRLIPPNDAGISLGQAVAAAK